MHRLLEIKRKLLITPDEVIAVSSIQENPDTRIILNSIQIAEERFIKAALCKALYEDIRSQKNTITTSVNKSYLEDLLDGITLEIGDIVNASEFITNPYYMELWNEHLWKVCAESVIYIASPMNYSRFTNQGEMLNNPANPLEGKQSASVELGQMKWKMDKMLMDRISPLLAGMEEWLYDNRSFLIKYNCKKFNHSKTPDGVAENRKTPWIFNVYDVLDKRDECYQCDN